MQLKKILQRIKPYIVILLLALMMLTLSSCLKSEFKVTENTEKRMTITAQNAARDVFFMTGSLVAAEGERITISSDLKKGSIQVEIFESADEQSIDKIPETDGEARIMIILSNTDSASGGVTAGTYLVKATCLEKTTGTVRIEIKPAE